MAPSVQCRKVWLTPTTRMPFSNAAKTPNPLKFAAVPQTNETISVASGPSSPYYGDMWRRYCCLTSFFPIVYACLSSEDIARQSCAMVPQWRYLWLPYGTGQTIIFSCYGLFFLLLLLFFPRLISAAADWMSAICLLYTSPSPRD